MSSVGEEQAFARQRAGMVARQLRARGVRSERVLAAMGRVRRERFVPDVDRVRAYDDRALPIAAGQTISQPYVVAVMCEALALDGDERVLEVGTGSGYAAAVLAELAGRVFTIERHRALADAARERLAAEGAANVTVRCGDGSRGWPEQAPFDGIVVAAGVPTVPPALERQLAVGGRMVIPVGPHPEDLELVCLTREGPDRLRTQRLFGVRFVPLVAGTA